MCLVTTVLNRATLENLPEFYVIVILPLIAILIFLSSTEGWLIKKVVAGSGGGGFCSGRWSRRGGGGKHTWTFHIQLRAAPSSSQKVLWTALLSRGLLEVFEHDRFKVTCKMKCAVLFLPKPETGKVIELCRLPVVKYTQQILQRISHHLVGSECSLVITAPELR